MSEFSGHKCTKELFLNDVKNHNLEIIRDDGIYRHLRLSKGSFDGRYDVLTWPFHLCITGDYGSFLFERTNDMFGFFGNKDGEINPHYWSEKVLSQSVFGDGIMEFSVEKFTDNVIRFATEDIEDDQEKAEIMEEIDVLLHCGDEWECVAAMRDFSSEKIDFADFWENDCKVYTFHFIWCLYAIVFAIQKYDEAKEATNA